jgi:hypothetical protein
MAESFGSRLTHAFNVFRTPRDDEDETVAPTFSMGVTSSSRPDRVRSGYNNDKSLVTSIYTRLSIDVASISMRHVLVDDNNQYVEDVKSGLNECLTIEANLDQGARHFRQSLAMLLFEEGIAAVVPVELSPSGGDIQTLRAGKIVQWYPTKVRVNLYDEPSGMMRDVIVPKRQTAIIENPLFSVMNEPNSNLQRLVRKLNLLDSVDEQSASGKLDLIIQLPYVIKTEAKREQANQRRNDIEMQLKGSKYGIAYTDGTEKVTQLNRPAENNMLKQIEYLTQLLYGQLGLTEAVFTGTASEAEMLNYHNRTVEPILTAISEAFQRSFLSKNARTRGHAIRFFRDPFKLVPLGALAEIVDKFTRNEVASSNEFRSVIGFRPSKDPKADELRNSNMPQPSQPAPVGSTDPPTDPTQLEGNLQNAS